MKRFTLMLALLTGCSSGPKKSLPIAAPKTVAPIAAAASDAGLQKGITLERKGDLDGALQAYRVAYERAPEADGTALSLARSRSPAASS